MERTHSEVGGHQTLKDTDYTDKISLCWMHNTTVCLSFVYILIVSLLRSYNALVLNSLNRISGYLFSSYTTTVCTERNRQCLSKSASNHICGSDIT